MSIVVSCDDKVLRLSYEGVEYGIKLITGRFEDAGKICSEGGVIELQFL